MARKPEFYLIQLKEFLKEETISVSENSVYTDFRTKLSFICKACDYEFSTKPQQVYAGKRCPFCDGKKKDRQRIQAELDLLGKDISVIGDYTNAREGMECSCDNCGYLWSTTYSNLKRNGCPSCPKRVKGSIEELEGIAVSYGKPIKILSEYVSRKSGVTCLCENCGLKWETPAASIVNGSGCPNCAPTGYNPSTPAYLYYLRVVDGKDTFWKIGITAKEVNKRFCLLSDREKITILYIHRFESGKDARTAEQNILRLYKNYRVDKSVKPLVHGGNTELFTHDVLQMDHLGGDV